MGIRKSGRRSKSNRGDNRSRVRKSKSRRSKSDEYEYKAILANLDKFSRKKELAIKEKEKRELERLEHIMKHYDGTGVENTLEKYPDPVYGEDMEGSVMNTLLKINNMISDLQHMKLEINENKKEGEKMKYMIREPDIKDQMQEIDKQANGINNHLQDVHGFGKPPEMKDWWKIRQYISDANNAMIDPNNNTDQERGIEYIGKATSAIIDYEEKYL